MKQFKLPRLIKINQPSSIIENLPENQSYIDPQCKKDQNTSTNAEMSTFEYSQVEDINENLYPQNDESVKDQGTKEIDRIVKIDANKYAEITWKQNEMILNGKKYQENQRKAQQMKVNALRYEIEKLEKRTEQATSDIQVYQNQFQEIQCNHKDLEEDLEKQKLLTKFTALEDQINNAVDENESEAMKVSYTPSEMNILIDMGFAKNDSLLNKYIEPIEVSQVSSLRLKQSSENKKSGKESLRFPMKEKKTKKNFK